MSFIFSGDQPLEGLLKEEFISFNIRRSTSNYSPFPRKVTLLNALSPKKIIIPGLQEKSEKALVQEIKQIQKWKEAIDYSFEIPPHLFSYLWRFKGNGAISESIQALKLIDKKEAKKVLTAYKKFQNSLMNALSPGKVYLFPDSEITFQRANRVGKGYARPVLILNVKQDQLVIIPFSTRTEWIDPKMDILFDRDFKGPALDPKGTPAVENLPYSIFTQKTALCVHASQPILRKDFLEAALVPKGVLRREVLSLVHEKLKKS